jgi:hypothetical protein
MTIHPRTHLATHPVAEMYADLQP